LQRLDRVVPLGLQGVRRVDLQNQVDAAAQVEAELDRLLQRVLEPGLARTCPFLLRVLVARKDVAGDGTHDHENDQQDSPAKLLAQVSSPKKRTAQCTGRANGLQRRSTRRQERECREAEVSL